MHISDYYVANLLSYPLFLKKSTKQPQVPINFIQSWNNIHRKSRGGTYIDLFFLKIQSEIGNFEKCTGGTHF